VHWLTDSEDEDNVIFETYRNTRPSNKVPHPKSLEAYILLKLLDVCQ